MYKYNLNCRSRLRAFIGLMIFGTIFLMTASSGATIITVPGDYPTIQDGINASADYDTVLVAPGHYIENVNFNGKDIVLTSHFMFDQNVDYIFNTIIDGSNQAHPDTGSTVLLVNNEGPDTRLQGFTITGGTGTLYEWDTGQYDRKGGGVILYNSTATVQYNYIYENKAVNNEGIHGAGGGGIQVLIGNATIRNNIIAHNEALFGVGISLGHCTGIVRNNVIAYNYGGQLYSGSGIQKTSGGPTLIENNTFIGNKSPSQGAAIKIFSASPILRNNIVWYNEGPMPHVYGCDDVAYCNVEGGIDGTGNIDIEPHLDMNTWLYPYNDSPGIDAGDPGASYFDIESPVTADSANWPSFGGLRNDMGAYGGPGAFPFHPTIIYSDTSVGAIPFNVSFEAYSAAEISDWIWDFDDGDSSFVQKPTHLYDTPGQHDVILQAVTVSGDTLTYTQPVYALADTIRTDDIEVDVSTSNQIEVTINITNNVPVQEILLPVEYSGNIELKYNSHNTTGCRTELYSGIELVADTSSKSLLFDIKSQSETPEYLPVGSGPVLVIVFDIVNWTTGSTTISLDGYDATYSEFTGNGFSYTPEIINGVITISYECGDANGDGEVNVGDAVFLINYVFKSGDAPQPVESGDANIDGNANVGDAVYLINFVFKGGPKPCDFASQ